LNQVSCFRYNYGSFTTPCPCKNQIIIFINDTSKTLTLSKWIILNFIEIIFILCFFATIAFADDQSECLNKIDKAYKWCKDHDVPQPICEGETIRIADALEELEGAELMRYNIYSVLGHWVIQPWWADQDPSPKDNVAYK